MRRSLTKQYKRDWMWRKRHPGQEPPPYESKQVRRKPIGNEEWQKLEKEERLWLEKQK